MRRYRLFRAPPVRQQFLTVFRGYHHRPVIEDGECYDMKNLTSDEYPLLSVRKARYAYAELDGSSMQGCEALHSRSDHPVVINGYGQILCHGHALDGLLETNENGQIPGTLLPKKIVSMGAWCIIFPDKVWFNAVKLASGDVMTADEDYGSLENETRVRKGLEGYIGYDVIRFTSVCNTGAGFEAYSADRITCAEPPATPEHGDYWCNTSADSAQIRIYDSAAECWTPIVSTYLQITAEDRDGHTILLGKGFSAGDGIEISGLDGKNVNAAQESPVRSQIHGLNGAHRIVACTDEAIVIEGCIGAAAVSEGNPSADDDIVLSRRVPDMDFVVACENRLWGCRYGLVNGERINEIYACRLGDFKNWNCFFGLSTDSYTASRGAEGEFTGAAVLDDTPLFFREKSFEKVFPAADGAHRILTVTAPGIERESWRSAVMIGGVLYYKGTDGVYAYTGSVPQCISYKLGEERFHAAVAGSCGTKYYISMKDDREQPQLFVFDTLRKLWHREDNTRFYDTAEFDGALYFEDGTDHAQRIGGVKVCTNVPWMAQSGVIGLTTPDQKRIGKLLLRLRLELGAELRVSVQYDSDGHWHEKGNVYGNGLQTVTVPIVPVRCDHLQLRLEGIGGMQLYSVAYQLEQGSDVP